MSKIRYPDQWIDAGSEGLVVNHTELIGLCKANGLNSGNVAYIADRMVMTCMRIINDILEDRAKENQPNE